MEAVHWAKKTKQEVVMLKLDFTKAYDSIEWDFLLQTLVKLGFGPYFRKVVGTLLGNASASVVLNGEFTPTFPISRSVRQGCPLAPFLFLIVMETLGRFLRACSDAGKLEAKT